jgi:hypothetical protein
MFSYNELKDEPVEVQIEILCDLCMCLEGNITWFRSTVIRLETDMIVLKKKLRDNDKN